MIKYLFHLICPLSFLFISVACGEQPFFAPQTAEVLVTFDQFGGTSGFAATVYAQEVSTGKTIHIFYPAKSNPIAMVLEAPGTYIFYANLIEAPEDYHYGSTICKSGDTCQNSDLIALDVSPGGSYSVIIADRKAPVPTPNIPVTVPWYKRPP